MEHEIRRLLDVSAECESNDVVILAQDRIRQRSQAESFRLLSRANPATVRERLDAAPAEVRCAALSALRPRLSRALYSEIGPQHEAVSTNVSPPVLGVIAQAIAFGTPPLEVDVVCVPEADSIGRFVLRLDENAVGRALFQLGRHETLVAVSSVNPPSAMRLLQATGLAGGVSVGGPEPGCDRRTAYLRTLLSHLLSTGLRGESAVRALGRQHVADLMVHANRSIRCAVTSALRTGRGSLDASIDETGVRKALTILEAYEARNSQV